MAKDVMSNINFKIFNYINDDMKKTIPKNINNYARCLIYNRIYNSIKETVNKPMNYCIHEIIQQIIIGDINV
ncbi:MAG: hypothetical protein ACOC33_02625 [bacterium]